MAGRTVLVVDDYEDARVGLAYVLRAARFDVVTADSGEDALRQLADGLRPCVVLLDLRMVRMDGWDVLQHMRSDAELAAIPVVIVSGDVAQHDSAQQSGIEFVRKPVDFDEVIAVVGRYCEHAR